MPANEDELNGKKEKLKSNENVDLDLAKSQSKGKQLDEQRKTSVGPKLMRRKSIDFESRLNRIYSFLLVKYYWVFLIVGLFISIVLSAFGFMKQPLPNILDPTRGFGARGEGTLTSQLIVLKNVNIEMQNYTKYIVDLYEQIKRTNKSTIDAEYYRPVNDTNETHTKLDGEGEGNDDDADDANNELDENPQEYSDVDYKIEIADRDLMTTTVISVVNLQENNSIEQNYTKIPYTHFTYAEIMGSKIFENLTGSHLYRLLPDHFVDDSNQAYNSIAKCDYSLNIDENFEFYFENSHTDTDNGNDRDVSLLTLQKVRSLCQWDKRLLKMMYGADGGSKPDKPCYMSLPLLLTIFSNKKDCVDINEDDIANFKQILNKCENIYRTGALYAAALESKEKTGINLILNANSPKSIFFKLPQVRNNICLKHDLLQFAYEYVLDQNYMKNNDDEDPNDRYHVKYTSLWVNTHNDFGPENTHQFYMKYFYRQEQDDKETKISSINFLGIRQDIAMRLLAEDMKLVIVAISLICLITLLYLRSSTIALIVLIGVALSVGVSFFLYRIVMNLDLFPFINMMAAFLLIGIACDNVFVLFDTWYNEKYNVLMHDYEKSKKNNKNLILDLPPNLAHIEMFIKKTASPAYTKEDELNPNEKTGFVDVEAGNNKGIPVKEENSNTSTNILDEDFFEDADALVFNPIYIRCAPLTDQQMIRIMGGTLRHAASSIFVTSFTTAAAFLTNMITKMPYVQLFGLFTGICILVYFLMVITMVSAFVVFYEKHTKNYACKLPINISRLNVLFDRAMSGFSALNNRLIGHYLPMFLIKARVALFLIFLVLGIVCMVVVFYKPKLKTPVNWRMQFFSSDNLFETFEFKMRDEFFAYLNEEKRNLTNPEIFFIFGLHGKDTGAVFNPDDDGYLVFDKNFDFTSKGSQLWINNFINVTLARRRDLFHVDELVTEWNNYLNYMQLVCFKKTSPTVDLPFEPQALKQCRDKLAGMLVNSSIEEFEELMSLFPRRIVFIPRGNEVAGILLRVNSNSSFVDYQRVRDYYLELEAFHKEVFDVAPVGYKSGWFISTAFVLYDLQYQLITGTYASLIASMAIALVVLLLTSGNVFISFFAITTITFSIAFTIAVFVLLGWHLSFMESIIIIMSVGLSVDFVCHYGVGYMHAEIDKEHLNRRNKTPEPNNEEHNQTDKSTKVNNKFLNLWKKYNEANKERFLRIRDTFKRIGSAVLMAAFTTFLAGASMQPSHLTSFSKMGEFLMLVMFTSYVYSTFFFMPLCALFGPTNNFGDIRLKLCMQKLSQHLCACLAIDDSIDAKLKEKKDKVKKLKTAANGCKNQKSATSKQPLVQQNTDITISFKNNDEKLAVLNNSTPEQ